MRIWSDGRRVLRLYGGSLTVEGEQSRPLGPADTSQYLPADALAVAPDGDVVWIAEGKKAVRVTLADGARESFGWSLVDAAYEAPGRLIGLERHEGPMELVRFTDAAPEVRVPVALPPARPIAWPLGPAYQLADEPEWTRYGEARVTTTDFGTAVAHVSGLLFIRWSDGTEVLWRAAPVDQGWICAYVHADGVVVSAVHNGRTGEIVWLDREGVWVDAYDSQWKRMGPCVPSPRGFISWVDEQVVRFEGHPLRIVESVHVGGTDADVAVDPSLTHVAVTGVFGSFVVRDGDVQDDFEETDPFTHVAEPLALEPIRFAPLDDETLGCVPAPDAVQVRGLLTEAEESGAASELLQARLAMTASALEKEGARAAVLRHLHRHVPPVLDGTGVRRALTRLARGGESAFVDYALRRALPQRWHGLEVTEPVEEWLRDHAALVHEYAPKIVGVAGASRIERAELLADASRGPVCWKVRFQTDGPTVEVAIVGMELEALTTRVPDEPHVFVAFASLPDGSIRKGYLTLELSEGGWAHPVRFEAKTTDGEKVSLLCGALFDGLDLSAAPDPELALRSLATGDLAQLHRGQREGRDVVHARQFPLERSRAVEAPAGPWPALAPMLEQLVADELLELAAAPSEALLLAVQQAFFGHLHDLGRATRAVENVLLDADEVDELYADPDALGARLDALLAPA